MIESKKIEIFCGTGGVGKTTIATSRALFLASVQKKILLITIDPSRRLKQTLGLQESDAGEVISFSENLDVLLMSPDKAMENIAKNHNTKTILENRILKILTKPYGGLHEILSVVELYHQVNKNIYDTIVLDTPPGHHFLDFLESTDKIKSFFDDNFIEIFSFLGKKIDNGKFLDQPKKMLGLLVSSGIKKLLEYLKKVTGEKFVSEFLEVVSLIFQVKESFVSALKLQDKFKNKDYTNWFLVTSASQDKLHEASEMKKNAEHFLDINSMLILNKTNLHSLQEWKPSEDTPALVKIKDTMLQKEMKVRDIFSREFSTIIEFEDVFDNDPKNQVQLLMNNWNK